MVSNYNPENEAETNFNEAGSKLNKVKPKLAVSACLLGSNCKYNGGNNRNDDIAALTERFEVLPVCPECSGGLTTPREPAEIRSLSAVEENCSGGEAVWQGNAQVISRGGREVTPEFKKGALLTLDQLRKDRIGQALLKEGSPSCGSRLIYDGTFSGRKISGCGVTTALLRENGITVFSENDHKKYLQGEK